jgi:hypothetical protein
MQGKCSPLSCLCRTSDPFFFLPEGSMHNFFHTKKILSLILHQSITHTLRPADCSESKGVSTGKQFPAKNFLQVNKQNLFKGKQQVSSQNKARHPPDTIHKPSLILNHPHPRLAQAPLRHPCPAKGQKHKFFFLSFTPSLLSLSFSQS